MLIDIAKLRADTPACETLTHFNNAGASLMPAPVYAAMTEHQALEQAIGGYEAQDAAAPAISDFYDAFADMLNCDPIEIAFMESATKAWDAVFYALPLELGDRVLVHRSTYSSSYLALLQLPKRQGLEIDLVPSDAHGQIDVDALPGLVRDTTRLILLAHCPSQSGLIQPAEAVGRFAKAHGLLYLLDACQSTGQMPLDVAAIGCDALTGTGRKFLRGPRGTGFLYMRRSLAERMEPTMIDMQGAEWLSPETYRLADGARRFETWERNIAGKIGLAMAVRYALDVGLDGIARHVQSTAQDLRDQMAALPHVTVHDPGIHRSGIVTFSKAGIDVQAAKLRLRANRINVSTVPQNGAILDAAERHLPDMMRASAHCYNSGGDIARLVEAVAAL
jgi:cysteine desulfurase/selenocysteine lyase